MRKAPPPPHPGSILRALLTARGITPYRLAVATALSHGRLADILHERRGITPDQAQRFALALATEPRYWLDLQSDYDLHHARTERAADYAAIVALA